jgi:predicted O-methyltransferase YrrM
MTRAEQLARQICHWLIATRDRHRLYRRFGALKGMESDIPVARAALRQSWDAYNMDDTWIKEQTISLELAATLLVLCQRLQPASILDLGSGYSSLIFRSYAQCAKPQPDVWSVDDSAVWLERTRDILAQRGLDIGTMTTWAEFNPRRRFDLILHDLGNTEVRRATVDRVCELLSPNGVIVLDDAHHYRTALLGAVRRAGLKAFSLRRFTLDGISRYAFLASGRE